MKLLLLTVALAGTLLAAQPAHADTKYETCQRNCTLNGLTCVLRCLANSGSAPKTDSEGSSDWLWGSSKVNNAAQNNDTRGRARNFPEQAQRPYNSDFKSRNPNR